MEAIAHPEEVLEEALFEAKRVLVGQDRMIERLFVCWLARGHCLLEGAPGLAKTLAAETVARILGGSFARLQFTPDLVPADLVGTRIYRPSQEAFDIELGPIFANVVLADEINRAPAKVQSALLEVMAERHVSIGGVTHPVPAAVPRARDPEPDRERGRVPAARSAARPVPDEGRRRLPERREEAEIVRRMSVDPPRPTQVLDARADARRCSGRPTRSSCTTRCSTTRFGSCSPRGSRKRTGSTTSSAASRTAPARAPRSALSPPDGRSRCCAAAATSCRRTSTTSRRDVLRHRVLLSYEALADGVDAEDVVSGSSAHGRRAPRHARRRTARLRADRRRCRVRRRKRPRSAGSERTAPAARARSSTASSTACSTATTRARARSGQRGGRRPAVPTGRRRRAASTGTSPPGRTSTHVRDTIADRELETWLVVDGTASLDFGTAHCEKRDLALAAAAAFGFLTSAVPGNRVGAVCFDGDERPRCGRPRSGRDAVLALLHHLEQRPRRRTRRWPRIPRGRVPTRRPRGPAARARRGRLRPPRRE